MTNELKLKTIYQEIINAPENQKWTQEGLIPIYQAASNSKIVIIGQAPGAKAQTSGIAWDDLSGNKLRLWLGINKEIFYNADLIALIPMDFYFPGKGKSGDLPPRKDFADKWHNRILACMPRLELIILIGAYAQKYYLKNNMEDNLTKTVKNFKAYLPKYFTLVHPSPLNIRWQIKNPWFEHEAIPVLQEYVKKILQLKTS